MQYVETLWALINLNLQSRAEASKRFGKIMLLLTDLHFLAQTNIYNMKPYLLDSEFREIWEGQLQYLVTSTTRYLGSGESGLESSHVRSFHLQSFCDIHNVNNNVNNNSHPLKK